MVGRERGQVVEVPTITSPDGIQERRFRVIVTDTRVPFCNSMPSRQTVQLIKSQRVSRVLCAHFVGTLHAIVRDTYVLHWHRAVPISKVIVLERANDCDTGAIAVNRIKGRKREGP